MTQGTELKASEHLDAAADYIEKYGLHKGWYFKGVDPDKDTLFPENRARALVAEGRTPPCCTLGALEMSAALKGGGGSNVLKARPYLTEAAGTDWWGIPDWNDKRSQRKDRVVKTLRKAAGLARKDGK